MYAAATAPRPWSIRPAWSQAGGAVADTRGGVQRSLGPGRSRRQRKAGCRSLRRKTPTSRSRGRAGQAGRRRRAAPQPAPAAARCRRPRRPPSASRRRPGSGSCSAWASPASLLVYWLMELAAARNLQDAAGVVLPAGGADPRRARLDRVRPGHADRGGRRRRASAGCCWPASIASSIAARAEPGAAVRVAATTLKDLGGIIKESSFLTAKTSAMVCWLFVGSCDLLRRRSRCSAGRRSSSTGCCRSGLTPVQFMLLSQFIIFILGWPLEWTEIIVIFMPIFIPLLPKFDVDPLFFGLLVALNLQTAFLSPPVAMAAFYLKGVSPPHVTLNQIFAGMMPFMGIQVFCIVPALHVPRDRAVAAQLALRRTERCRPKAMTSMRSCRRTRAPRKRLARLREGSISSEELVGACLARIARRRGARAGLDVPRSGACARSRRAQPTSSGARAALGAAARHSGRHQGHHRHRGHADRERHACCTPGARRRRMRPSCACCARPARSSSARPSPPSSPPTRRARRAIRTIRHTHAGRLVERLGRGGGGAHGAARPRHPDQRLGDPAGRLLRRVRLQTQLRLDPAAWRAQTVADRWTRWACSRAASRMRPCWPSRSSASTSTTRIPGRGRKPPLRATAMQEPPIPPHLAFIKTPTVENGRCREP